VLTLSDIDLILGNQNADQTLIKSAIDRMEQEKNDREFSETELTMLGIGHLNLQNLQNGYNFLYEASKLNPENFVLSSHVNSILIRLEDFRRQSETMESKPKGKTILVVDDSQTVRKLIAGKLSKCGHKVFCCADGVEAMKMLSDVKADLVLLDINMPNMDGYQTCKAIRGMEERSDVPVVMISGKDGFFDKVRGKMAGTSGYITKPFGPETLMKTVDSFLAGEFVESAVETEHAAESLANA
jgi:twitching motility two-component system response regulator PilG